jgi:hypothetical protein
MSKITDPELLALLNGGNDGRVTDPAILAELNGGGPTLASEATAVGASLGKGVANLVGLPGDILKGARWVSDQAAQVPGRAFNYFAGDGSFTMPAASQQSAAETDRRLEGVNPFGTGMPLPGGSDIVRGVENITGQLPKPQTTAGQYLGTLGEFAPTALLSPGTALQRAAMTAVPAVASETAGQVTKGTAAEPYARLAGALAGGVGTAWAQSPSYANRMTARAAQDVTPQQFRAAETLMRDAQARGVTLTVDEALQAVTNGATRLGDVRRVVESTTEGGQRFAPVMAQRPGQMQQATEASLNQIAPRSQNPSLIGSQMQDAGQGSINGVRRAINQATTPLYAAAAPARIPTAEYQRLQALPGYNEALATVRNTPQLNRYVANLPDDSVGVLNEVQKQLRISGENAAGAFNPARNQQVAAGYGIDADDVTATGRRLSPEFGRALDVQAQARQRFLDPLDAGPVGKISRSDDFVTQGRALMGDRPAPREVATATQALMNQNPQATRGLVREQVGRVADRTVAGLDSAGRPDQFAGAKFAREMRGNARERENIETAIRTAAGPNAERDVSRLVDVLGATGWRQRQGSLTAFNQEAIGDMQRGGVQSLVQAVMKPLQTGKDTVARARLGSQAERLAEILLSGPDGVRRVEQIAAQGTGGNAALAKALLTYSAASP